MNQLMNEFLVNEKRDTTFIEEAEGIDKVLVACFCFLSIERGLLWIATPGP